MNTLRIFFPIVFGFFGLLAFQNCGMHQPMHHPAIGNPAAQGFDEAGSDPEAMAIADEVMAAQGGRANWDQTQVIGWKFFDSRTLLWDKHSGNVRIEWLKERVKVIVNINTGAGKVLLGGTEQTHPDSLKKYLQLGREAWINDSYWLVMPFKLKDTGVRLLYKGVAKTGDGREANLLQLSFDGVGVTPNNKYLVWVDKSTRLVTQWAFFENFLDVSPRFTNPWTDYLLHGKILLSSGRGFGKMGDIRVYDSVPEGAFDGF